MSENDVPSVYTDKLKAAIESIPQELHSLSETALRTKLNPTVKLYELKRAFWEELVMAQDQNKKMRLWRIYDGKCSKQYFFRAILSDPLKMAWITSPLVSYQDRTQAVLDKALERYDEIISMEITTKRRIKNEDGDFILVDETDPKKALVLLQAIKNLEDRVRGSAVQRQLNVHTAEPSGQGIKSATLDMQSVEERLNEIQQKLLGGANGKDGDSGVQQANVSSDEREDRGDQGKDYIDASCNVVDEEDSRP